jgi:hypothetical protein
MPAGLQVRDAGGNLKVDLTDRLPKILDLREIAIPAGGGWVNVDLGLAGQRTQWAVFPLYCWISSPQGNVPVFTVVMELTASGYRIRTYSGGGCTARVVTLGF